MKILKEIGRDPQVDWILILIISIVVAVSLAFTGLSLYNAVTQGTIVTAEPKKSAAFAKLNEKSISTVLDLYSARKAASSKALAGYTGAPDPSI
jgi:hypothetical protein